MTTTTITTTTIANNNNNNKTLQWLPIALKIKPKLLNIYFKIQFYVQHLLAVQIWATQTL